jgi:transposase-like protein
MNKNAYRGHRFPPAIIQVTVWMYARFTLSLRDVEELLAERGLDISYETVRPSVSAMGGTDRCCLRSQLFEWVAVNLQQRDNAGPELLLRSVLAQ